MGALFTALFNSNSELKNFELNWNDIEKSHPMDASLHNECQKLLQMCREIQTSIDNYEGGKDFIANAMRAEHNSEEQKEMIRTAMIHVIPNAALCQSWFQFAGQLSSFMSQRLLPHLAVPIIDGINDHHHHQDDNDDEDDEKKSAAVADHAVSEITIMAHQALTFEFATILDTILTFDQKKMRCPQIQNDFSFYKRNLGKRHEAWLNDLQWSVSNEKAGFISMFLAHALPLQKEVATQLASNAQCLKVLAIFCNACYDLLKENKFKDDAASQQLALRAMTAAFVIYDHGNEAGAFQRSSLTKAAKIVAMIATEYVSLYGNKEHTDALGNMIKYGTIHFNDAQTPMNIKNMLP
eukprot:CAMPEP_0202730366 /NCGR_PEP_ID=MMETSP1385-20130828/186602_1 /ASSEMBLY_ACC=CAM_ASM_000861 /TAXON_ID=933848 /ORGANISM="Elphidium margaritaceum" /LENGTH=351 /DNA_ID=CAMNT_0049396639 /DNA_START=27 /DNA_END=1082 /DNA_ORIENTATION=-